MTLKYQILPNLKVWTPKLNLMALNDQPGSQSRLFQGFDFVQLNRKSIIETHSF